MVILRARPSDNHQVLRPSKFLSSIGRPWMFSKAFKDFVYHRPWMFSILEFLTLFFPFVHTSSWSLNSRLWGWNYRMYRRGLPEAVLLPLLLRLDERHHDFLLVRYILFCIFVLKCLSALNFCFGNGLHRHGFDLGSRSREAVADMPKSRPTCLKLRPTCVKSRFR